LGYSLQANRKILEESDHPDHNAQFEFINDDAEFGRANPYGVYDVASNTG
jgi:hypothetical protein